MKPILELTQEDTKRGNELLKRIGVDRWFVSLHVREGKNDLWRNADIMTYIPAIEYITKEGWVIRIGEGKALPDMHRVIDYANSPYKSDWMDVYLCAKCKFFIGTSSGMYTIAMAFGVPICMTNLIPYKVATYLTSQDLFISKLAKKDNKYLTFKEMYSSILFYATTAYQIDGYELIDNTPEEIKEVTEEMYDYNIR